MKRVVITSAAHETANVLREEILRDMKDDEWLLGSEDEVMHALGVSRPTLRQALRLLEQEQLVAVRRGVGGGLFARRPTEEGVTHTASVFLRSEGTTFGDLTRTLCLLATECARLAASHGDRDARKELINYYPSKLGDISSTEISGREFVILAGGFFLEIAELAGSPSLRLFVSVLIDLARPAAGSALYTPDRIDGTIVSHTGIARAIANGKARVASEQMEAHFDYILEWTDESLQLEALYPHPRTRLGV